MTRQRNYQARPLTDAMILDGWKTPDTYARHYAAVPNSAGIYLFMIPSASSAVEAEEVVYVGMSIDLARRMSGHEVYAAVDGFCQFWFKPVAGGTDELRSAERHYIRKFFPRLNIIGKQDPVRKRGGCSVSL